MKQLHVVVTGGGSGIGAAVAKRLLADGMRVTLMGRSEDRLRSAQAALGDVSIQVCDVGNEDSVTDAFAAVGDVDILVNNAGQVETAPLARTSLELWQRVQERGGCVTGIGSMLFEERLRVRPETKAN